VNGTYIIGAVDSGEMLGIETFAFTALFSPSGLSGNLDEIAVYNYELNQSQVSELYNSGAGFNPYALPDTTAPTLSDFNMTSDGGCTAQICNITNGDLTPTYVFDCSDDTGCAGAKCSKYNLSYDNMNISATTSDNVSFSCTLNEDEQLNFSPPLQDVFFTALDTLGNNHSVAAYVRQLNITEPDNNVSMVFNTSTSQVLQNGTFTATVNITCTDTFSGNCTGSVTIDPLLLKEVFGRRDELLCATKS
jgi:hypothetical protein